MKKVVVLGAGRVGSAIAIDLSKNYEVTSVDQSEESLIKISSSYPVKIIRTDLSVKDNIKKAIAGSDLVISAVPGFMGFETLKTIIESRIDVVDIAFFPENPFELDELAKQNGVTAVIDAGVAPGMGNIILGYHNANMKVEKYECLVGGLPVVREWPYEYKAVFSPIDVIEEYIRPARYVQNGKLVIREALSDPELLQFEGIGTLESWNSDGLRTLVDTMDIPDMIEKTLRYPGTIEYLRVLRDTGFFSYDEIDVNGQKIRPIDLTAKLLFPKWQLKEGEEDFTVMRIVIEGIERGEKKIYRYDLLDRYDRKSKTISMARTTGYTCTAVANLLLNKMYQHPGINPPEYIGAKEENFRYIKDYLAERNVNYLVRIIE